MDHLLLAAMLNVISASLSVAQASEGAQQEFATALQNVNEAHRALAKYAARISPPPKPTVA